MRNFLNSLHRLVLPIGIINDNSINILGTAFLISDNLICTTYHNIANQLNLVIINPKINNINEFQNYNDKTCNYSRIELLEASPHRDIAIFKIEGQVVDTESIFEFVEAPVLSEMIIVGYPHSVEDPEGRFILTFQKTYIGSKILLNSELGNIQNKNYILNTQTRPGQSGSPVFDRNFNVIGMLIGSFKLEVGAIVGGINPSSLNQTSYVISSEYIKEML